MSHSKHGCAADAGVTADGAVDIKSVARLDTDGKTVDQVFQDLCRFLRGTELEPEWLCHANLQDDANEAMYGARHSRPWPEPSSYDRISVSVCIGNSGRLDCSCRLRQPTAA